MSAKKSYRDQLVADIKMYSQTKKLLKQKKQKKTQKKSKKKDVKVNVVKIKAPPKPMVGRAPSPRIHDQDQQQALVPYTQHPPERVSLPPPPSSPLPFFPPPSPLSLSIPPVKHRIYSKHNRLSIPTKYFRMKTKVKSNPTKKRPISPIHFKRYSRHVKKQLKKELRQEMAAEFLKQIDKEKCIPPPPIKRQCKNYNRRKPPRRRRRRKKSRKVQINVSRISPKTSSLAKTLDKIPKRRLKKMLSYHGLVKQHSKAPKKVLKDILLAATDDNIHITPKN